MKLHLLPQSPGLRAKRMAALERATHARKTRTLDVKRAARLAVWKIIATTGRVALASVSSRRAMALAGFPLAAMRIAALDARRK